MGAPRSQRAVIVLWLAVLMIAGGVAPSAAAVRHCAERVEAMGEAPVELQARREALERWAAAATAIGQKFAKWQLADARTLRCVRIPGGFRCRAGGAPCTISQVPSRVPKELEQAPPPQPPPFPPRKKALDI